MVKYFSGEHLFLTSDLHFSHENIISFCNRPFENIEAHDAGLINNWNSIITPEDTVFILGDFCWGGMQKWEEILKQLNGHKFLFRGNHDNHLSQRIASLYFEEVVETAKLEIGGYEVFLGHYPLLCYPHHKTAINLFGHVHSGPRRDPESCENGDLDRLKYLFPTQYDVGVDNNNYRPISWTEILEKIKSKQIAEQIQQSIKLEDYD